MSLKATLVQCQNRPACLSAESDVRRLFSLEAKTLDKSTPQPRDAPALAAPWCAGRLAAWRQRMGGAAQSAAAAGRVHSSAPNWHTCAHVYVRSIGEPTPGFGILIFTVTLQARMEDFCSACRHGQAAESV
jgi:hypothetical protein